MLQTLNPNPKALNQVSARPSSTSVSTVSLSRPPKTSEDLQYHHATTPMMTRRAQAPDSLSPHPESLSPDAGMDKFEKYLKCEPV